MFSIDWSIIQQSLPLLAQGALVTLKITITAIAFGMVIGTLLAVARISVYACITTVIWIHNQISQ